MSTFGSTRVTTYKKVEIDGIEIANPSNGGVSITREMIQSSNTRRTSSAKMVGKVVGIKVTYKFSFPPSLKSSQIETIKNLVINKTFKHKMKVVNEFGKVETFDCYFGNYSTELYGFLNGKLITQSLSFEAVEI